MKDKKISNYNPNKDYMSPRERAKETEKLNAISKGGLEIAIGKVSASLGALMTGTGTLFETFYTMNKDIDSAAFYYTMGWAGLLCGVPILLFGGVSYIVGKYKQVIS